MQASLLASRRVSGFRPVDRTGTPSPLQGEGVAAVPFGIAAIDNALGGGLLRAALHEIAAARESATAAASGFALAVAARIGRPRAVAWIAEDMGFIENGAPYGPGLDETGLAPERLMTIAAAKSRDVLRAMEEALRCRAVGAVIGEIRSHDRAVDFTASRRLSLAAGQRGGLALLLRTEPGTDASAAASRWVIGPAPSLGTGSGPGPPRFAVRLARNRRGPLGSWMLEWNRAEQRFDLASSLSEPMADAACDRSHRAIAAGA